VVKFEGQREADDAGAGNTEVGLTHPGSLNEQVEI
jgi:hypothetical protein